MKGNVNYIFLKTAGAKKMAYLTPFNHMCVILNSPLKSSDLFSENCANTIATRHVLPDNALILLRAMALLRSVRAVRLPI